MRGTKLYSMFAALFMAGAFLASPELRAYASIIADDVICTCCVGTSDLGGNAITAAKIKDREVKTAEIGGGAVNSAKIADNSITAADIATDAVGAAELQGVTKLLFGQCNPSGVVGLSAIEGGYIVARCNISGVDTDDSVIATLNGQYSFCFDAGRAYVESSNVVAVWIRDRCKTNDPITDGAGNSIAVMVYDK